MEISPEKVRTIAHLARLDFSEEEEQALIPELEQILDWMSKLRELDTEEVEPLTHLTPTLTKLRADEVKESLSREKGLKNAPQKDSNYFRVPKVLD